MWFDSHQISYSMVDNLWVGHSKKVTIFILLDQLLEVKKSLTSTRITKRKTRKIARGF